MVTLLRCITKTKKIINHTHGRGSHSPQTKPYDPNYKLGLRATTIRATIILKKRKTSYVKIYRTVCRLSQRQHNYFTPPIKFNTTPNNISSRKYTVDSNDEPWQLPTHNLS